MSCEYERRAVVVVARDVRAPAVRALLVEVEHRVGAALAEHGVARGHVDGRVAREVERSTRDSARPRSAPVGVGRAERDLAVVGGLAMRVGLRRRGDRARPPRAFRRSARQPKPRAERGAVRSSEVAHDAAPSSKCGPAGATGPSRSASRFRDLFGARGRRRAGGFRSLARRAASARYISCGIGRRGARK